MDDTICAIATPCGEGGIGIVRLSGPRSVPVASRIVRLRSGRPLSDAPSFRLQVAEFFDPSVADRDRASAQSPPALLDEGLVVVMRAPHSYTREDVVELHCHGGALILTRLCAGLLHAGARLAQPGEFTKRAFLNGRLDLTQAEAVLDTIHAKTDAALRQAQDQLRGTLAMQTNALRSEILALLAHVEAGIDFVEEDLRFIDREELGKAIRGACTQIERWLSTAERGRIVREGLQTVIVGRPNVGKSSLLNALIQRDRAIVTPIPGTTRDVLEEFVNMDGIPLRLLDTAGIRDTTDPVELEGVRRSRDAVEQAELIFHVLDASQPLSAEDEALLLSSRGRPCLILRNKIDLSPGHSEQDLREMLVSRHIQPAAVVNLSAITGQGLDRLREAVRSWCGSPSQEPSEAAAVTRLRHAEALGRARTSLQQVISSIEADQPAECVAMDLRVAADALGELTGAITTEDVLNRIFSEFCIGK